MTPNLEEVSRLIKDKAAMHASILIVLERLRPQSNVVNPSLLVIRECIRELSKYEFKE